MRLPVSSDGSTGEMPLSPHISESHGRSDSERTQKMDMDPLPQTLCMEATGTEARTPEQRWYQMASREFWV